MKFSDIPGQQKIKELLIKTTKEGRIPHAQLFNGPNGYGTLALAIAYAQYILCEDKKENDSCGICPSCYKISKLEHPDLHFSFPVNKSQYTEITNSKGEIISDSLIRKWREQVLTLKPNGYFTEKDWYNTINLGKNSQGNISRAEANEIIRKLSYKSFEGGYKILIIWLPERMNEAAANALLKLFEEPAEKTLFLFVTADSDSMLKTILSRTQIFNIPPIDTESIYKYLSDTYEDKEKCAAIARMSGGDCMKAVDMMEDNTDNENFELFSSLMRLCYTVNHLGLIEWAENIAGLGRESQKNFLTYSLNLLRESYILSVGVPEISYIYGKEAEFINKFYPFIHYKNIVYLTEEFEKAIRDLSSNGNAKIIFIHFALSISKQIRKV